MKKFITLFLALFLLTACQSEQKPESTGESLQATVVISQGEEIIADKGITFTKGQNVLDIMKSNFDTQEDKGFIYAIEGRTANEDEKEYWAFKVDGEYASVGAGEYVLEDKDEVNFNLEKWE